MYGCRLMWGEEKNAIIIMISGITLNFYEFLSGSPALSRTLMLLLYNWLFDVSCDRL